jgi:predicted nucleotidyltransferase
VRIEPNSLVSGFPALTIRKLVRRLNNLQCWNAETVRVILRTEGGAPRTQSSEPCWTLASRATQPEQGVDGYQTTPLAQAFGSATAAKPITRRTADRALSQLIERIDQVNRDETFLAKVTKVVVLGSYLRADVDFLSDVDIAVELQPKEPDRDRLRELNRARVEQLHMAGRRFSSWIAVEYWWHLEAFSFLKGRSRAISLIDYKDEKEFVYRVPHRVLFSSSAGVDTKSPNRNSKGPRQRSLRPRDCPF